MQLILAIILGGFFGFALTRVQATKPSKILAMLRLQDLTLMKSILFAIGLASVLLAVANIFGIFDISHLSIKSVNLGVVIGGLIFGLAFGWIGACPGTCVGSLVNSVKQTLMVIIGGLFGALAFSLTYDFWLNSGVFDSLNYGKLTLFNISDKFPSIFTSGFGGLALVGGLFMLLALVLPQKIRD